MKELINLIQNLCQYDISQKIQNRVWLHGRTCKVIGSVKHNQYDLYPVYIQKGLGFLPAGTGWKVGYTSHQSVQMLVQGLPENESQMFGIREKSIQHFLKCFSQTKGIDPPNHRPTLW